jgi:pyridoxine 5-phosphate synthase
MINLTVMLDHVAGLRENMRSATPDPVAAAMLAELAGADGIAVYLREDRRHIQDRDVRLLRNTVQGRFILHMTSSSEMVGIALDIKPERVILMPAIQESLPPERGIDLTVHGKELFETIDSLQTNGISVGISIAAEPEQAQIAHQLRANWVQIHAGGLREATTPAAQRKEVDRIIDTIKMAYKLRTHIAVGQGLDHRLIKLFAGIPEIDEFSLGQSIIAQAMLLGMSRAVERTLKLLHDL